MAARILDWPVREGLLRYLEKMKDDARRQYYQELKLYGLKLLKDPPKVPRILRDG